MIVCVCVFGGKRQGLLSPVFANSLHASLLCDGGNISSRDLVGSRNIVLQVHLVAQVHLGSTDLQKRSKAM